MENNSIIEPWMKESRLFLRWEAMKREINMHKWYESERVGYDIGWEKATVDWMIHYGPVFFKTQDR